MGVVTRIIAARNKTIDGFSLLTGYIMELCVASLAKLVFTLFRADFVAILLLFLLFICASHPHELKVCP